MLALIMAACGETTTEEDVEQEDQEDAAAETETDAGAEVTFELRIGTALPLTGDLGSFGPSIDRGAELAVEVIQETLEDLGLDEITVQLVAQEDTQTQQGPGVEAAQKLVQSDGVGVIIGAMASNVTIPIAESVTVPNEVALISPTSTSPAITDLDDDGLVFRILSSDALQGEALADAVLSALGDGATANVGARNDAFGVALKEIFEESYQAGGGQIGEGLTWAPDAASLESEAQRLLSGEPDGWVIIDFPETFQRMAPALVRAGDWDPSRTFLNEAMRNEEVLSDIGAEQLDGIRGTAPTSEDAPARSDFDALFTERASDLPLTGFEGSSFDAVMLAFLAAVHGGAGDGRTVADNLQAVSGPEGQKYTFLELGEAVQALLDGEEIDYEGAWGPIDFDENGDPGSAVYEVWSFTDGAIETLETFVFQR